jgi:hypothetical protein
MNLVQTVAMGLISEEKGGECPFAVGPGPDNKADTHGKPEEEDDADGTPAENKASHESPNYTPNKSADLAKNLGAPPDGFCEKPLDAKDLADRGPALCENVGVLGNAHHLIPGHAALPLGEVVQFIGEKKKDNYPEKAKLASRIKKGGGGIGYNVNAKENGVWLPSNNALRGRWDKNKDQLAYQAEYAFLAINRTGHQFHDAHVPYNNFVIKLLNQLNVQMLNHLKVCELEPCKSHRDGENLPYAPQQLKGALNGVSARLRAYMPVGAATFWRVRHLITSRLSLVYARLRHFSGEGKALAPQTVSSVLPGDAKAVVVTQYAIDVVTGNLNVWARQKPPTA